VTEAAPDSQAVPVWARETAFPDAPSGWGWVDPKDGRHPCASFEELAEAIRSDDTSRVCLVWIPENPRMVLPEEVPAFHEAVLVSRNRWVKTDLEDYKGKLRWAGIVFALLFGWTLLANLRIFSGKSFALFDQIRFALKATVNNTTIEIAFLILIIFVVIPWYQAWKRDSELAKFAVSGLAEATPTMRFEIWLERQQAPFTRVFLILIALVGLVQFFPGDAGEAAGLTRNAYFRDHEWWRLFTAPFLHGNPIHFALNAAALVYLGKRLEVFARWPHLPLVFLFSAVMGGQASVYFREASTIPSVGASGGLMGWLGFLLVFETLHSRLVPKSARRRLAAAVVLTGMIGLIGHAFIDNAAHAGGLVAGMLYAAIVFPKSSSVYRPQSTLTDRIAGTAALVVCIACAAFTVWKIL
jgi:membrane associated rhomboid family serine protease